MTNESDAALEGMIVHLSHELKHVKMEIESERSKMKELTSTINKLGGNRSGPESNLITQLEHSQTTLKQELSHAIQSKLELLLEANKEMERLRNIIKIEHLDEDSKQQAEYMASMEAQAAADAMDREEKKFMDDDIPKQKVYMVYKGFKIALDEKWPHCNESKIDFLKLVEGDRKTYCSPFSSFNLKYTGYYIDTPNNSLHDVYNFKNWIKFTSAQVSDTVYSSRLGHGDNIIGLEQAILQMTEGCKALIWVPCRLAWGEEGAHPLIPPRRDVVFELDLVWVERDIGSETLAVEENDLSGVNNTNLSADRFSGVSDAPGMRGMLSMHADGSMTPLQQPSPARGMPNLNIQDSNPSISLSVPSNSANANNAHSWDTPGGPGPISTKAIIVRMDDSEVIRFKNPLVVIVGVSAGDGIGPVGGAASDLKQIREFAAVTLKCRASNLHQSPEHFSTADEFFDWLDAEVLHKHKSDGTLDDIDGVFFYYSGHGTYFNTLLINSAASAPNASIQLVQLSDIYTKFCSYTQNTQNSQNLQNVRKIPIMMVIDCCRGRLGPEASEMVENYNWLSENSNLDILQLSRSTRGSFGLREESIVIFGDTENYAGMADHPREGGIFTNALMNRLMQYSVDLREDIINVRNDVFDQIFSGRVGKQLGNLQIPRMQDTLSKALILRSGDVMGIGYDMQKSSYAITRALVLIVGDELNQDLGEMQELFEDYLGFDVIMQLSGKFANKGKFEEWLEEMIRFKLLPNVAAGDEKDYNAVIVVYSGQLGRSVNKVRCCGDAVSKKCDGDEFFMNLDWLYEQFGGKKHDGQLGAIPKVFFVSKYEGVSNELDGIGNGSDGANGANGANGGDIEFCPDENFLIANFKSNIRDHGQVGLFFKYLKEMILENSRTSSGPYDKVVFLRNVVRDIRARANLNGFDDDLDRIELVDTMDGPIRMSIVDQDD